MKIETHSHKLFDLTESSQSNPIRYNILYKEGNTYTDQSGEFKCKDYMNDVVAKYHGMDLSVYGMDFASIKLNGEGVYLLLSKLKYKGNLQAGLALISEQAVGDGLPPLVVTPVDVRLVVFIDRAYFASTYLISYLMSCIRLCHSEEAVTSIPDMVEKSRNGYAEDNPFSHYRKQIAKNGFKNPCLYFTYIGAGKNEDQIRKWISNYQVGLHNNGVKSISNLLNAAGVWKLEDQNAL